MTSGPAGLPPLRILAADDTRTNLRLLEAFLSKLGHRVSCVDNGEAAVAAFRAQEPDLVLLDIMMPVMDGFEAARQIKAASTKWTPVIFLSALDREQNLLAGLEAGGDDYLAKPINLVILEAKLRSLQQALHFQRQALEARTRIENLSNSILDAIITIDRHGIIQHCNQATEMMFQWPAHELIGQNIKVLMPEPQRSEHDFYISRYLAGGAPSVVGSRRDVVALRRNGSTFPAELAVSELRQDGERMFIGILRDITEEKQTQRQLTAFYDALQEEQRLAKQLIELQLHRPGLKDPLVQYWVAPTTTFSGDLVAASRSPDGGRYAMLADATGHGLGAAISALPVLALFYRMTSQGHSITEIIKELNQQLRESVPTGRFVALSMVYVAPDGQHGSIWVGGTPAVMLIDEWGREIRRFNSRHLPLGIVGNQELDVSLESFDWQPGQQILLFSDGLIEAENSEGEAFGLEGLLATLAHTSPGSRRMALVRALGTHLSTNPAQDDVSLLLLSHS
ncbi:SpoIIE family protein phosphatase [Azovibrio restrictus]|uniref:SpoIIE family protein phosphatase n=1 Tax=Azovibrio restrictus TaxID=146938 RepID=UPI0026EDC96B|nr:SpoIIE family protein phosphatase [Azovibrio restrictus]